MNFIEFESPQKLRGSYYTQLDVASFLTQWVLEGRPRCVLEPACGDGVFFEALARAAPGQLEAVFACELNAVEAGKARARAKGVNGAQVTVATTDFLQWSLPRLMAPPEFDAALGNPPFIRYQYLDPIIQARAEKTFATFSLPFTKHTNAWVPFVLSAVAQLRPGGRLAMVVPAEILHVLHARSLRHFLLAECSRTLILDPEGIWFDDTLQGVMLLLAEKGLGSGERVGRLAVVPIKDRASLSVPASKYFERADFISGSALNGKWMHALLSPRELALLNRLTRHPSVRAFKDVASVDVGLVTGANKFFLVPDSVVSEFALELWAHPMFGRSEHVRGVVYDRKSHEENRRLGLPTNFLWFDGQLFDNLTPSAQRYIKSGEAQGLHRRYKCRIRNPWYSVPSVYATPVAMLKRCHHFPRLVLNTLKAYTTDTAYRVMPKEVPAENLVLGFVNSLTALSAELEGRHYGGGVLELVPSEIERLLVPLPAHPQPQAALADLDRVVRAGTAPEPLLAQQDRLLLKPLGIKGQDCDSLLAAWARLRQRRQRTAGKQGGMRGRPMSKCRSERPPAAA
jgi:adenine-specific DNA methylase